MFGSKLCKQVVSYTDFLNRCYASKVLRPQKDGVNHLTLQIVYSFYRSKWSIVLICSKRIKVKVFYTIGGVYLFMLCFLQS